jgi:hypothetical protein
MKPPLIMGPSPLSTQFAFAAHPPHEATLICACFRSRMVINGAIKHLLCTVLRRVACGDGLRLIPRARAWLP